jgi:hypothetical protein
MLFREVIAVYYDNYSEAVNTRTLCAQNEDFLNVKSSGLP